MARGLLVFLGIMAVETVHGVLRGLFLVPRVGEETAARLGWPVGMVLVLLISTLAIGWTGLSAGAASSASARSGPSSPSPSRS